MIKERDIFSQLDTVLRQDAARKRKLLSPNDILVQIALPLILILAITSSLMTKSEQSYLPDWQQVLILRLDRVLGDWERASGLTTFEGVGKMHWENGWPEDSTFKKLCEAATVLTKPEMAKKDFYQQALTYVPNHPEDTKETRKLFIRLYDPEYSVGLFSPDEIKAAPKLDETKREFAFSYIEKRCWQWKVAIENAQWEALEYILGNLPLDSPFMDRRYEMQLLKLTRELEKRGYMMLPAIVGEYGIHAR